MKQTQPKEQKPADMPLAIVFYRYWENHAKGIASAGAAKPALALWTEYWGTRSVADLNIPDQKNFLKWLKERGYKNSYVSRILAVGRSAVRLAWKNGEILTAPFIIDEADRSDEKDQYILEMPEMKQFLIKAQERPHIFKYCMIALNTLARPSAILELCPEQVDLKKLRINLNPKGRRQTNKYRPIVPITDTLLPFVSDKNVPAFILWKGNPIKSIKKTFATTVKEAGLSRDITPYSLRHTMATELRTRGVRSWELEAILGHRRPTTTERYARYTAEYLSEGRKAIDAYFTEMGLNYAERTNSSVSVACQLKNEHIGNNENSLTISEDRMVGVTGIEPVTPTMSM